MSRKLNQAENLRQPDILFRNAHLFDPKRKLDKTADLLIRDGKIQKAGKSLSAKDLPVIELAGAMITPGWTDLQAHFREPGREDVETVRTGCDAAAAGGFTRVCTLPDTEPCADTRSVVDQIRSAAEGHSVEVMPVAALTRGRSGQVLTEIAELLDAGAVAFSESDRSAASAEILRRGLEYAGMYDAVVYEFCEDSSLTNGGLIHEGEMSAKLGLHGIPAIAEEIIVARGISLAQFTGSALHFVQISTARSLEMIRQAKTKNLPVTCSIAAHHAILDESILDSYDPAYKFRPPLRPASDRDAVVAALQDGTIDAVASCHSPHAPEEKDVDFAAAPEGAVMLETVFGLLGQQLVSNGKLEFAQLISLLSDGPARVLRRQSPSLEPGQPANLTICRPEHSWSLELSDLRSRSQNTPYLGQTMLGKAFGIYHRGRLTFEAGE